MHSPLISVIIATCNHPEEVLGAVEPVIGQQFDHQLGQEGNHTIEIIVDDDDLALADEAGETLNNFITSGQFSAS